MSPWFGPGAWFAGAALTSIAFGVAPSIPIPTWALVAAVTLFGGAVVAGIQGILDRRLRGALQDRLEEIAHGHGTSEPGRPGGRRWAGVWAASDRVAARASKPAVEPEHVWAKAAQRLEARSEDSEVPQGADPRFEAALRGLEERQGDQVHALHRVSRSVADQGLRCLELLVRQKTAWAELESAAEGWIEDAVAVVEALSEAATELRELREELSSAVAAREDDERRLQERLRSAGSRLGQIIDLETQLRAGHADLDRLDHLVVTLSSGAEPDPSRERIGEARAIIAHLADSRQSWAKEASRAREHLEALADLIPGERSVHRLDATLEEAFSSIGSLTEAWAEHAGALQRLASAAQVDPRSADELASELSRALGQLGALMSESGRSNSLEGAMLERLMTELAELEEAAASGIPSRDTVRVLEELQARGTQIRERLDALVRESSPRPDLS